MSEENSRRYPLVLVETELAVIIILLSLYLFNNFGVNLVSENRQTIPGTDTPMGTSNSNDGIKVQYNRGPESFFGYPLDQDPLNQVPFKQNP
ncbi:MAG: hypothetical protein APF81_24330 [Desulfosporosinus sp. BRH_c37]|nr:MAG: hypothetical protein APF81_24330 [Desulfosporosinus sp. BRH_c37]